MSSDQGRCHTDVLHCCLLVKSSESCLNKHMCPCIHALITRKPFQACQLHWQGSYCKLSGSCETAVPHFTTKGWWNSHPNNQSPFSPGPAQAGTAAWRGGFLSADAEFAPSLLWPFHTLCLWGSSPVPVRSRICLQTEAKTLSCLCTAQFMLHGCPAPGPALILCRGYLNKTEGGLKKPDPLDSCWSNSFFHSVCVDEGEKLRDWTEERERKCLYMDVYGCVWLCVMWYVCVVCVSCVCMYMMCMMCMWCMRCVYVCDMRMYMWCVCWLKVKTTWPSKESKHVPAFPRED